MTNIRKKQLIKLALILMTIGSAVITVYLILTMKKETAPDRGNQTIHILTWKDIPSSIVDDFETANPGYTIIIDRYSTKNYFSFLNTKLEGDAPVDIVEIPIEHYRQYLENNALAPLSGEKFLYRFTDESLQYLADLSDSDIVYGIPYQSNYLGIWYNQAMFEKYSLAPPDNQEHFLKACEVLSQNKAAPLAAGLLDPESAQYLLSLFLAGSYLKEADVYQNHPELFFTEGNKNYTASLDTALTLVTKGYITPACLNMTAEQAFDAFLNNSYGMAVYPERLASMITASTLTRIKVDVSGFYVKNQESRKVVIGSPVDSVLAVCKKSRNMDIAVRFLDYYTRYDSVQAFMEQTRMPTNIQDYTVTEDLADSWAQIKDSDSYAPWELFPVSAFAAANDENTLSQKLFYQIISPEEFTRLMQTYFQNKEGSN